MVLETLLLHEILPTNLHALPARYRSQGAETTKSSQHAKSWIASQAQPFHYRVSQRELRKTKINQTNLKLKL